MDMFLEGIQLPQEGKDVVFTMEHAKYDYNKWKKLFFSDEQDFKKCLEQMEEKEKFLLWFYARLAVELYSNYQKDGIEDQIYYDTFYDFTIWYKRCRKTKGISGIGMEQAWWLALPLRRKLYRLGRLQFEIEGKVLHVHIPEGEKLEKEKCEESFRKALEFFKGEYQYFDCKSWLLSTNLKSILGEDSNIIQFQNLFEICEIEYAYRHAEERVFGYIAEDADSYPEDTSLQRGLKQYVKEYGDPGIGYGIWKQGVIC